MDGPPVSESNSGGGPAVPHQSPAGPEASPAAEAPHASSPAPPAEPTPSAAEPAKPGRRVPWRRLVVPAAAAVGVAAVVLTVLQTLRLRDEHADDDARRQAIVTATNYAVDLTTYDFSHLDAEFQKVLDESTGSFRSEYTAASASLRDLIAKFKATASGKVLETAVVASDTSHATVLLFVDQTVTNTNSTAPRVDRSRMKMGLEKHNGKWLISSLDLL
jgi:Mce-associated membrane protein